MDFMGQQTYQITGKVVEQKIETELVIPDDDVDLVSTQTGVSKEKALRDFKGNTGRSGGGHIEVKLNAVYCTNIRFTRGIY